MPPGAEREQDYPGPPRMAALLLERGSSWGLGVLWDCCCISVFPPFQLFLFFFWIFCYSDIGSPGLILGFLFYFLLL